MSLESKGLARQYLVVRFPAHADIPSIQAIMKLAGWESDPRAQDVLFGSEREVAFLAPANCRGGKLKRGRQLLEQQLADLDRRVGQPV